MTNCPYCKNTLNMLYTVMDVEVDPAVYELQKHAMENAPDQMAEMMGQMGGGAGMFKGLMKKQMQKQAKVMKKMTDKYQQPIIQMPVLICKECGTLIKLMYGQRYGNRSLHSAAGPGMPGPGMPGGPGFL